MILCKNRHHDFEVIKTWEAGLILQGNEIKSVAAKEVDLTGSYVIADKEIFLHNVYIKPFVTIYAETVPKRPIKLLLNKSEIRKLKGEKIIALDFHVVRGKVKVTIATVRKLKKGDKRAVEKDKEHKKEVNDLS